MDMQFGVLLFPMIYMIAILTLTAFSIYALILAIKALKIYIRKNS